MGELQRLRRMHLFRCTGGCIAGQGGEQHVRGTFAKRYAADVKTSGWRRQLSLSYQCGGSLCLRLPLFAGIPPPHPPQALRATRQGRNADGALFFLPSHLAPVRCQADGFSAVMFAFPRRNCCRHVCVSPSDAVAIRFAKAPGPGTRCGVRRSRTCRHWRR